MRGSDTGVDRLVVVVDREKVSVREQQHFSSDEQLCRHLAYMALRSALWFKKDVIRIELGAHVHEYPVAALLAYLRPRLPFMGSIVRGYTPRTHLRLGDRFEPRTPTWPGLPAQPQRPFSLQTAG